MKQLSIATLVVALIPFSASAQTVEKCIGDQCPDRIVDQGYVAYIDPETGELLMGEEAAAAANDAARSAFVAEVQSQMLESFDSEGLVETRTETGAIALDLGGRFQSPLVAEISPQGVVIRHIEAMN